MLIRIILQTIINLLEKDESRDSIQTSIDGTQQSCFTATNRTFDTYEVTLKIDIQTLAERKVVQQKQRHWNAVPF